MNPTPNRRDFLKSSSAAVSAASLVGSLSFASRLHAAGSGTIRVALIGCGGRGTGAASQAMAADENVELVAMADAFPNRLEQSLTTLKSNDEIAAKIKVQDEKKFVGFDAFQKAIDSGIDVALLTEPPHFRPEHLKAAVEKGLHCFVEKPIAVDAPGVRSVWDTCQVAQQKGLSIVSGLCWRYHRTIQETLQQIHDGAIGEISSMRCSYNTGNLWNHARKPDWSDMEWQLRNWLYFTWLSGDFIVEQHIHSLDKIMWAMHDEPPVAATGTGGRQARTQPEYGHVYDHFAIEYEFPNGVRAFSRCRQQSNTVNDVSDTFYGTKGMCFVESHNTEITGQTNWKYKGPGTDMYQAEHDAFFKSIRDGKPINNGKYMCRSTMMAILGRMVAYTGQRITWDQAWNSTEKLGPEKYEWTSLEVPAVAIPGVTKFS